MDFLTHFETGRSCTRSTRPDAKDLLDEPAAERLVPLPCEVHCLRIFGLGAEGFEQQIAHKEG